MQGSYQDADAMQDPSAAIAAAQAAAAAASGFPFQFGGYFPGYGFGGAFPGSYAGSPEGKGFGFGGYKSKGKGKGKGKFGDFKGKGKGFEKAEANEEGEAGEKGAEKGGYKGGYGFGWGGYKGKGKGKWNYGGYDDTDDPRRQIAQAQRHAFHRDRNTVQQAQRTAIQRFESGLLDRVQGQWVDESDPTLGYFVEGGMCSVAGGDNPRVFRNRISVYNGELCWDARRYWHNLDLKSIPAEGEEVQRCEWNPANGSPPAEKIVWIRGEPILPAVPQGMLMGEEFAMPAMPAIVGDA